MRDMCNYGTAIQSYGEQKGYDEATVSAIKNFKEKYHLSIQDVMDALEPSKEDQKKYSKLLS